MRGAAGCTHHHSILQRSVILAHRCRNCSPRLPRSSWEPISGAANPNRGSEHLVCRCAGAPAPEGISHPGSPSCFPARALLPGLGPCGSPCTPTPPRWKGCLHPPPGTWLAPTRTSGTQGHSSPLPSETLNSKTRPVLLHGANCFNLN